MFCRASAVKLQAGLHALVVHERCQLFDFLLNVQDHLRRAYGQRLLNRAPELPRSACCVIHELLNLLCALFIDGLEFGPIQSFWGKFRASAWNPLPTTSDCGANLLFGKSGGFQLFQFLSLLQCRKDRSLLVGFRERLVHLVEFLFLVPQHDAEGRYAGRRQAPGICQQCQVHGPDSQSHASHSCRHVDQTGDHRIAHDPQPYVLEPFGDVLDLAGQLREVHVLHELHHAVGEAD